MEIIKAKAKNLIKNSKIYIKSKDEFSSVINKLKEIGYSIPINNINTFKSFIFIYIDNKGNLEIDTDPGHYINCSHRELLIKDLLNYKIIKDFVKGEEVLVKIDKKGPWMYTIFDHYDSYNDLYCNCNGGFTQCIPYKGNEKLLGYIEVITKEEFLNKLRNSKIYLGMDREIHHILGDLLNTAFNVNTFIIELNLYSYIEFYDNLIYRIYNGKDSFISSKMKELSVHDLIKYKLLI